MHPVDLLHFSPELMDNNVSEIKTNIEISVATMGQDQRHRTVRRSQPGFSGRFYLPPIPDSIDLEKEAIKIYSEKNTSDFNKTISELINTLSTEKQEGETIESFT